MERDSGILPGGMRPRRMDHHAWRVPRINNYRFLETSVSFLRLLREMGTSHVVGLGTCIEYQITGEPVSEDRTPTAPLTTYARCKNDLRLALKADARAHGTTVCWGRVFYPFGVGEHPSRLCTAFIAKLRRGEKVILQTPGSIKDYVNIDDLAAAVLTTMEHRGAGVVNWGTGQGIAVREIARTLERLLGRSQLVEELFPPLEDPLDYVVADVSRLRSLGWRPDHTLCQRLEKLIALTDGFRSGNVPV